MLFGRTEPFDGADAGELYPMGKAEYLDRFRASLDASISAGFILAQDRAEILEVAANSFPLIAADA